MAKKGCLIQFSPNVLKELDLYAGTNGLSRNAAVNLACASLVGEADRLRKESVQLLLEANRLRDMVVKIAMAKAGVNV